MINAITGNAYTGNNKERDMNYTEQELINKIKQAVAEGKQRTVTQLRYELNRIRMIQRG